MVCPFRFVKSNTYKDVENADGSKIVVLDSVKEEYPECYEINCPHYHYSVSKMDNGHQGWYCTQAELINADLEQEEGENPWMEC